MSVRHSYSSDTARVIQELAKETQLTQLQKKGLFLHLLDKNKSLFHKDAAYNHAASEEQKSRKRKDLNTVGKLRKQSDIVQSGCYERDNYIPLKGKEISERDKEGFIFKLAYGCPRPDTPEMKDVYKLANPSQNISKDRKQELYDEISDRMTFLEDMKRVSSKHYDKSYVPIVKQEIALKLKELEELHKC